MPKTNIKSFYELTGFDEQTPEGIAAIQHAAQVIYRSEALFLELENANYHRLTDELLEFTSDLHVHVFTEDPNDYGEIECSYPTCWSTKYVGDEGLTEES